MNKILHYLLLCLPMTCGLYAAGIYVAPSGKDQNPGSRTAPLKTLQAAQQKARLYAGKEPVTVHIADGTYYLPDTLTFTPADSGTEQSPVVYKSVNEGGAIISGGLALNLQWSPISNGIFRAKVPKGVAIDQLFVDGQGQRMARYPNYDPELKAKPYQGYAADAFSKERAQQWKNPAGGFIHAMHAASWGGYHYLITGKDEAGEVTYEGGWQNNRRSAMHKEYRMVENILEELDAPSEWYFDAQSSTLYFMPTEDIDLSSAKIEVVRLRHLVEFQGSESSPVSHLTFQGFTFRHASRTFMDCKEPLLRSDWAIYRGGAFLLTGTQNINILDCEFNQLGGNAIFVNNYNRHALIKGCHIHDIGASGVCFVGDPEAVHDPLFSYGATNNLANISRQPGPKTNNYPSLSTVEDCLIHEIGRVERQPAGVQISMAMEITVRDCSIYDTARAGINVSEGTWGGHLIERCDVFDTVLETHDHGSFNSWGRDRYWCARNSISQEAVDQEPSLPYLDAFKTTTIRNSRWRCDHGWDIDLDDGSTNYDIYNNLMLRSGIKLREGYRRHVWNNVIPFGNLHPHVWFKRSQDKVTSNIISNGHAAVLMKDLYTDQAEVDRNFFLSFQDRVRQTSVRLGWDEHSLSGDPLFIDAANADFRVQLDSPALGIGFNNFPMDQFGVKKPSLKAIARTPTIPQFRGAMLKPKAPEPVRETMQWLGATLNNIQGQEFSAYGISQEAGGVALVTVDSSSAASKAGFAYRDVIQAVNGKPVRNISELKKSLTITKGKALTFTIVRDQKTIPLNTPALR